jgi:serine/threonine protein kinase
VAAGSDLTCPAKEQISRFLRGCCSDDEAVQIASHAANCSRCSELLRCQAKDSDTIVRLVRNEDQGFEVEPAFRSLRRRLLNAATPALSVPPLPMALGQYELLEPLGQGGMGRVFKARHRHLKRIVAVKLLAPERLHDADAVARFLVEIEAIGRLTHPNLVRATDAAAVDGIYFLVMEFEPGLDAGALLRRVGRLSISDACEIIRQAAVGLQFAHEHGLVHCDIKPSNLFVTDRGEVKILDLGLARISSDQHDDTSLAIAGTADYMAPEQWDASAAVDIRVDVYGLGCTLFKLLGGRAPYESPGATVPERQRGHQSGEIPSLLAVRKDVPAALDAIAKRMLAKERQERYAEPREVSDALLPFCHANRLAALVQQVEADVGDTVPMRQSAVTEAFPEPPSERSPRRRRIKRVAVSLCMALVIGVAFTAWRRDDSSRQWTEVSLAMPRSFASRDADCLVAARDISGHKALELHSRRPLFVPLGTATERPYKIRTTIADDFDGAPGIYFGFSQPLGQGDGQHVYQSVTVRREAGLSGPQFSLKWTLHEERNTQVAQVDHVLDMWSVAASADHKWHRLEVDVGAEGLSIVWDDTIVVVNAVPKAPPVSPDGHYAGAFGLYLNGGRAVFRGFEVSFSEREKRR